MAPVLRFRRRWVRSNVAYFVVCSPAAPSDRPRDNYLTIAPLDDAPRAALPCAHGQYIVLARSNAEMHSEARARRAFLDYFGARARITFVFTEREPCHEGGGCRALLQGVLRTHGADGVDTPVRYLYGYLDSDELATGADIARIPRRTYRSRQRSWATQDIRDRVRSRQ